MSNKKLEKVPKEFNEDKDIVLPMTLNSRAYSLIEKNGAYQIVKFNFDAESKTMSEIEVIGVNSSQYDAADDLIFHMEEEIYQ